MKKRLFVAGLAIVALTAIYFLFQHGGGQDATKVAEKNTGQQLETNLSQTLSSASNLNAQTGATNVVSPELDPEINPYAGALREPGKSKRAWDANFLQQFQNAASGQAIRFELTEGRMASGTIQIAQFREGEVNYLSGELTEPEKGKFFFIKPPEIGKAGKAIGVIEFPASRTAYRIEPTGPNGDPELWQRRMDEVVCNIPRKENHAEEMEQAEAPPLRPDLVPSHVSTVNSNVVSLQSRPGSTAVLLLDFFGGYTPTWGGVTYAKPNSSNEQIKDIWKRVAEDYLPFNINVTTDLEVFQKAPEISRQRCVFSPTASTVTSGGGVAYIGSWNWGGDTVCWSVYFVGKAAAEVASHEGGHTLNLGHQGTTTDDYYGGHGSGATGWAPIMGVGYDKQVTTWAKGEYQNANNTQEALNVIVTQNNAVAYRPDDTTSVLAGSRYLEIYPDLSVYGEGAIERTGDTDAFQFTTTGGVVSLKAFPVNDWANLAMIATLANSAGTVISSNNPQTTLSAGITQNLPAGTYTFRVTGAGRNTPSTDGFSSYASLGYYSIAGKIEGARLPTRLDVLEFSTNQTIVGSVSANSSDPLAYTIVSGNTGNTFSIDNSGVVRVANNTLLNYDRLASNTVFTVQYQLFVNIVNLADSGKTELNRRVVIEVINSKVNNPIAVTGFNAGVIVRHDATAATPEATGFDIANNFSFYQTGLSENAQVSGTGGEQGLPTSGLVLSQLDGTRFQLGPYGGTNALLMGYTYPVSGTLTFATPQAYNSLAILASSANGGGRGSFVLNYTNGSRSQNFQFNAQDWFGTTTNVAIQGIGRVRLGQANFNTENPGWNNPNLYQTTLDLAALGINQTIQSITFTRPSVGGNHNAGVFAVSGRAMAPQVSIVQQPQSVTNNNLAQGATFSAVAMGAPPLSWQWFYSSNGNVGSFTPLLDKTNSSLVLNPTLQNTNAGSYYVAVSNSFSVATSSVATLTLYRAPVIVRQPSPSNLALFAGKNTALSVAVNGALPMSYHWQFNNNTFAVGSSSNYTLVNLQVTSSGNYTVIASNAFGMATSSVVSITVVATPTNYPYTQAVLTNNPIAFFRLNESSGTVARDYVGGRNGIYFNTLRGQPGYSPVDLDRAARFGPSAGSYVGNIPIDFGTTGNANFSIEAWVRSAGTQTSDAGIVTKGTGAGGEQFNLDTGGGNRAFRFFVRDAGGTARLATSSVVPDGNWHHLVGVCNQAAGFVALYVDGVSNASGTIDAGSGILFTTNEMTIGSRQSGTASFDNQFNGFIDEVAIYNYALSPALIQAHYNVRTNRPPLFTADPFSRASGNAGAIYSGTIAGSATDPNNDSISYSKIGGPAWLNIASNGALSGTPGSSDAGTNSFTVRAGDLANLFSTATLQITVNALPMTAAASLQNGELVLSWSGGAAPYQLQFKTNLNDSLWQNFEEPIIGNSITFPLTNEAKFYRIVNP